MDKSVLLIELHKLGWRGFQDLSGEVLRRVLGQSFVVFADSNDGGRDGAFYGDWDDGVVAEGSTGIKNGPTVLQCKFSVRPGLTLSLSSIGDELEKISKLVDKGMCDNYILMTNSRVTGKSEAKIIKAIKALGVKSAYVLDGNWVCDQIVTNQSLRLYVPRVYGLGDLSQIIDERSYRQAKELLDQLGGLSTFVVTQSYKKAADAIHEHGFVLLLGEPSSGKSVIAATLAMASADSSNSLVVRVANAAEFKAHWNPDESESQFFWIDDAFGAIIHDESMTDAWSKSMTELMAAIKKGAKVVMTSRDYIYRDARPLLKEYAFPLLREGQVVIDVNKLSLGEKEQILYNHIKLGNQPAQFRTDIKPYLGEVVRVRKFLPEVARRLGNTTFTKGLDMATSKSAVEFMEKPKDYLADVYAELSDHQRAAMALIYKYTNLTSPISQSVKDTDLLDRLGTDILKVQKALKALNGVFFRYSESKKQWSFHHPTLREGYASYIMHDAELTDILLDGFEIDSLLDSISCGGDSKLNGQLINIPKHAYGDIVHRLSKFDEIYEGSDFLKRYYLRIKYFDLLKRSDDSFLTLIMDNYGDYVNKLIKIGLHGSVLGNSSISMAYHLRKTNKLNELLRLDIVQYLSDISVSLPDSGWASWTMARSLLDDPEAQVIERRVRTELISNLHESIDEWEREENDDEDYYEDLKKALDDYTDMFFDDSTAQILLEDGKERILSLESDREERRFDPGDWYDEDRPPAAVPAYERSVFEDIDA